MSLRALVVTSVAALAFSVSAHASTFAFENYSGATLPLSITSGGVTATFTLVAGNAFTVGDTTGLYSFNTALEDLNGFSTDPLTISFSTPVSGTVVIPFGFEDAFSTTDSLMLTANTGQTLTVLGMLNNSTLAVPEGVAQFALNAPITSLTLTGSNPNATFAIGDFSTVATVATPEPSSLSLLGTGLLAAMGMVRKRFA